MSNYHFVENSACFVLNIEFLLPVMSNFEKGCKWIVFMTIKFSVSLCQYQDVKVKARTSSKIMGKGMGVKNFKK